MPPTAGPTRRTEYSLAFDPGLGGIVLFGGWNGKAYLGDTWLFHNGSWSEFAKAGPVARARAAMAFDGSIGTLVLVGGFDGRNYRADAWSLNGSGWSPLKTGSAVAPPARASAAMAYDPDEAGLVLVGGTNGAALGDAWELRGTNWSALPRPTSAVNRTAPMIAYDETLGGLVLFGGSSNASRFLSDTWLLKQGRWTAVSGPVTPNARADAAFGYDPVDGGCLLFGGTNGSLFSDTWIFREGNWTLLHPPSSPPASDGSRLTADPFTGTMVLFGGWIGTSPLNGTWTFRAAPPNGTWQTARSGGNPWSRSADALAFDDASGQLVLFGGQNPFPTNASNAYFGDTWLYGTGAWSLLAPATAPAPRAGAGAAFDASLGGIVLFGGWNGTVCFNDTWLFRAGAWTRLSPGPAPSARAFPALASDPADHGLLLFGGELRNQTAVLGFDQDTWRFHDGRWVNVPPAGPVPSARAESQLAFDPSTGQSMLFGGLGGGLPGAAHPLNDTWRFHLGIWQNRSVVVGASPPGRFGGTLLFDPGARSLLLLGGSDAAGRATDLWTFRTGQWSGVCGGCDPTAPTIDSFAFDPGNGAIVAPSGYQSPGGEPYGRFAATELWAPPPFVNASTSPAAGTDVNLSATSVAWWGGGIGPWGLSWTLPNGTFANGPSVALVGATSGTYAFLARLSTGTNLTASGTGSLVIHPLPTVRLRPAAYTVTVHAPLYLGVNVTGGTPPMSAAYQNLPLGCAPPTGLNLSCRPAGVGAYAIEVTITDAVGANSSRYVQLNISPPHPAAGPSPLTRYVTVGVIAGILLLVLAALWFRRRDRLRRQARAAARRRALELAGRGPPPVPRPPADTRGPPKGPS